jgi:hypothetical protein
VLGGAAERKEPAEEAAAAALVAFSLRFAPGVDVRSRIACMFARGLAALAQAT